MRLPVPLGRVLLSPVLRPPGLALSVAVLAFLLHPIPALAQASACEESVKGDAGEVIASIDERGGTTLTWVVQRRPGIGQQTEHTSRPALMLDFAMARDGGLGDVKAAIVSITSYSDPEIGKAPPLSSFRVRASVNGKVIEWVANRPEAGEPRLVRQLKDAWPDVLVLDLVDKAGELVASATFDLRARAAAGALAQQARAKCRP